jgi:hypothetical protein
MAIKHARSLMVCRSVLTYLRCWAPVAGRRTSGRTSSKPPFSAERRPSIVPASSAPASHYPPSWPARVFSFGPRSLLIGPSQKRPVSWGMGPFRDARGSSSATQGGPDPAFEPSCFLRAGTLTPLMSTRPASFCQRREVGFRGPFGAGPNGLPVWERTGTQPRAG